NNNENNDNNNNNENNDNNNNNENNDNNNNNNNNNDNDENDNNDNDENDNNNNENKNEKNDNNNNNENKNEKNDNDNNDNDENDDNNNNNENNDNDENDNNNNENENKKNDNNNNNNENKKNDNDNDNNNHESYNFYNESSFSLLKKKDNNSIYCNNTYINEQLMNQKNVHNNEVSENNVNNIYAGNTNNHINNSNNKKNKLFLIGVDKESHEKKIIEKNSYSSVDTSLSYNNVLIKNNVNLDKDHYQVFDSLGKKNYEINKNTLFLNNFNNKELSDNKFKNRNSNNTFNVNSNDFSKNVPSMYENNNLNDTDVQLFNNNLHNHYLTNSTTVVQHILNVKNTNNSYYEKGSINCSSAVNNNEIENNEKYYKNKYNGNDFIYYETNRDSVNYSNMNNFNMPNIVTDQIDKSNSNTYMNNFNNTLRAYDKNMNYNLNETYDYKFNNENALKDSNNHEQELYKNVKNKMNDELMLFRKKKVKNWSTNSSENIKMRNQCDDASINGNNNLMNREEYNIVKKKKITHYVDKDKENTSSLDNSIINYDINLRRCSSNIDIKMEFLNETKEKKITKKPILNKNDLYLESNESNAIDHNNNIGANFHCEIKSEKNNIEIVKGNKTLVNREGKYNSVNYSTYNNNYIDLNSINGVRYINENKNSNKNNYLYRGNIMENTNVYLTRCSNNKNDDKFIYDTSSIYNKNIIENNSSNLIDSDKFTDINKKNDININCKCIPNHQNNKLITNEEDMCLNKVSNNNINLDIVSNDNKSHEENYPFNNKLNCDMQYNYSEQISTICDKKDHALENYDSLLNKKKNEKQGRKQKQGKRQKRNSLNDTEINYIMNQNKIMQGKNNDSYNNEKFISPLNEKTNISLYKSNEELQNSFSKDNMNYDISGKNESKQKVLIDVLKNKVNLANKEDISGMEYYRDYESSQSIKGDILKNEKFPFIFYDSGIRNLVVYYKEDYNGEIKSKYFSAQRFGHATAKKIALNFLRSLGINVDYMENNNIFSYEKDTKSKLYNIGKVKMHINKEENSDINLTYDKKKRNVIVSWINKYKGYNFRKFSTQRFGFDVALCLSIDFYRNLGGLKEEEELRNYINEVNNNFRNNRNLANKKKKKTINDKINENTNYIDNVPINNDKNIYDNTTLFFINNIKHNVENIKKKNMDSNDNNDFHKYTNLFYTSDNFYHILEYKLKKFKEYFNNDNVKINKIYQYDFFLNRSFYFLYLKYLENVKSLLNDENFRNCSQMCEEIKTYSINSYKKVQDSIMKYYRNKKSMDYFKIIDSYCDNDVHKNFNNSTFNYFISKMDCYRDEDILMKGYYTSDDSKVYEILFLTNDNKNIIDTCNINLDNNKNNKVEINNNNNNKRITRNVNNEKKRDYQEFHFYYSNKRKKKYNDDDNNDEDDDDEIWDYNEKKKSKKRKKYISKYKKKNNNKIKNRNSLISKNNNIINSKKNESCFMDEKLENKVSIKNENSSYSKNKKFLSTSKNINNLLMKGKKYILCYNYMGKIQVKVFSADIYGIVTAQKKSVVFLQQVKKELKTDGKILYSDYDSKIAFDVTNSLLENVLLNSSEQDNYSLNDSEYVSYPFNVNNGKNQRKRRRNIIDESYEKEDEEEEIIEEEKINKKEGKENEEEEHKGSAQEICYGNNEVEKTEQEMENVLKNKVNEVNANTNNNNNYPNTYNKNNLKENIFLNNKISDYTNYQNVHYFYGKEESNENKKNDENCYAKKMVMNDVHGNENAENSIKNYLENDKFYEINDTESKDYIIKDGYGNILENKSCDNFINNNSVEIKSYENNISNNETGRNGNRNNIEYMKNVSYQNQLKGDINAIKNADSISLINKKEKNTNNTNIEDVEKENKILSANENETNFVNQNNSSVHNNSNVKNAFSAYEKKNIMENVKQNVNNSNSYNKLNCGKKIIKGFLTLRKEKSIFSNVKRVYSLYELYNKIINDSDYSDFLSQNNNQKLSKNKKDQQNENILHKNLSTKISKTGNIKKIVENEKSDKNEKENELVNKNENQNQNTYEDENGIESEIENENGTIEKKNLSINLKTKELKRNNTIYKIYNVKNDWSGLVKYSTSKGIVKIPKICVHKLARKKGYMKLTCIIYRGKGEFVSYFLQRSNKKINGRNSLKNEGNNNNFTNSYAYYNTNEKGSYTRLNNYECNSLSKEKGIQENKKYFLREKQSNIFTENILC
ncbi:conserved Plasmodium protein, unknown function, partial [Plasmodium relictum]